MASRRLSRGTPTLALTKEEQEARVRAISADSAMMSAVEVILGKSFRDASFGEKLVAYGQHLLAGEALAPFVAAERVRRDLQDLAADRTGEMKASDRAALLTDENQHLHEELTELRKEMDKLYGKLNALTAEPARAINAGEDAA